MQKGRSYAVLDGVQGCDRFTGMKLASGMNGHNTCWVEGETRMYIDGEECPSLNHTGTEDCFCGTCAFGNDIEQTFRGLYVGMQAILYHGHV